ncbi:MAG: NurA domain protein [Firmicutes bacterium]|nr:NurA domain protein [Bacillota bacterium]
MADEWVMQLQRLNGRLSGELSDERLGDRTQRRETLRQIGELRPLNRLNGEALAGRFEDRLLVGVDGTINSFGSHFPYYVDFLRALAKPSRGEGISLKDIHCPLPPEDEAEAEIALRNDNEVRQRKLANLEVQAALAAIDAYRPAVILMDGPLVRFDMRTKESFSILREKVIQENILLAGCIENIESKVIASVMGDALPSGWRNRYDRDLLWRVLDYGEVLEVARPAKGTARQGQDADTATRIRTWFMQSSREPGVVGLDLLEEQAAAGVSWLADYLFTISPADGRGIPIWLDLVDREVRLTHAELEAYVQLLDPQVRRVFASKRDARFF